MDYLNILAFGRNVRRIFNFFNLSFTLDIMVQINFRVSLLRQCKLSRNRCLPFTTPNKMKRLGQDSIPR